MTMTCPQEIYREHQSESSNECSYELDQNQNLSCEKSKAILPVSRSTDEEMKINTDIEQQLLLQQRNDTNTESEEILVNTEDIAENNNNNNNNNNCILQCDEEEFNAPSVVFLQQVEEENDHVIINSDTCHTEVLFKPNSSIELSSCIIDINQVEHNNIPNETRIQNPSSPTKLYDSVSLSEPNCRVCQCNDEEEKLISPCHCCGSVKWVHESCLVKWMKCSFKDSCELCRKQIEITKRRKPFSKWKLPSQRPTPVLWVLVFVTAIALNLASVVKDASRLCSSTPCLVFYAVGCIGVILGTLFLIYWSKRARNFIHHWMELNEEWVVIISDKDKRVELKEESTSKVVSQNENNTMPTVT